MIIFKNNYRKDSIEYEMLSFRVSNVSNHMCIPIREMTLFHRNTNEANFIEKQITNERQ